jgi:hypothetical protein
MLRLAGEERNAKRLRGAHLGGNLGKHRDTARDVEATDAYRQARCKKWAGEIDRARKLI